MRLLFKMSSQLVLFSWYLFKIQRLLWCGVDKCFVLCIQGNLTETWLKSHTKQITSEDIKHYRPYQDHRSDKVIWDHAEPLHFNELCLVLCCVSATSPVNNFLCAYFSSVQRISHFTGQSSRGMLHEQGSRQGFGKIQSQIWSPRSAFVWQQHINSHKWKSLYKSVESHICNWINDGCINRQIAIDASIMLTSSITDDENKI